MTTADLHATSRVGDSLSRRIIARLGDPRTVRALALASVVCYALLVLTGGAVRLTGSGLGCADWPECFQGHLVASASFHPLVEFTNRVVTIAVSVVTVIAFLSAVALRPRRRDLVGLGGALIAGLIAQIILGGIVVLTKLNPYLVALHFVLTLVVLAAALVMYHLARTYETHREPLVRSDVVWLARLVVGTLCVLILAGTIVTGAGPHAGGKGAKRIPIAFRDIAELHSTIALFLIGCTLASLFALHVAKAPARTQRVARTMLEVLFIQGTLGYTQYFLHDASVVIEFHLAGATAAWIAAVTFYLSLHRHPEPVRADKIAAPAQASGAVRVGVTT
ncbi:MAG: COX15/CtaA family protein [Acidimicrobiales bacterium]